VSEEEEEKEELSQKERDAKERFNSPRLLLLLQLEEEGAGFSPNRIIVKESLPHFA